jgi:CheY-like chemotaxis protein
MKTVLVVDDEKSIRDILTGYLGYSGFDVNTAVNGQDAIDSVNHNDISLVMLDLSMPVMDGVEAFKLIRKDHPQLPIIIITGSAVRLQTDEFSTVVRKPFNFSEINTVVNSYIHS